MRGKAESVVRSVKGTLKTRGCVLPAHGFVTAKMKPSAQKHLTHVGNFPNPHSARQTAVARWCRGVRLNTNMSAIRIAGMFPVIIVLFIHALAYITAVLGTLVPLTSTHPLPSYVLLVVFHFVFVLTIANYLLLVFADPGSVPADWKAPPPPTFHSQFPPQSQSQSQSQPSSSSSSSELPSSHVQIPIMLTPDQSHAETPFRYAHLMQDRTVEGFMRYCRVCRAYKPDRAHHCSVCKRCILRMDHHCVFINNCVSFYNHKFFIAFVTYAFLGCVIVSVVAFPTFADIIALPNRSSAMTDQLSSSSPDISNGLFETISSLVNPVHSVTSFFVNHALSAIVPERSLSQLSAARQLPTWLKTAVMIGYIVSSAFSFALGVFVTLHFYLLSKGRTTIEMYEMTDPIRAPAVAKYDLGFGQNVKSVCGSVPLCWLFPTRAYIEGDGLQYTRRGDSLAAPSLD